MSDVAIPSAAGNKTFVYVVVGTHGRPPLFVFEVGGFNVANAFRDQIRPLAQDAPALHLVDFAADSRPVGDRSPCTAALGN